MTYPSAQCLQASAMLMITKLYRINPVTITIDAKRVWNWCTKISMEVIVSKTKVLGIKGNAIVEVNNTIIEKVHEIKVIGIIVTNNLNWTENAKNKISQSSKGAKALKAKAESI